MMWSGHHMWGRTLWLKVPSGQGKTIKITTCKILLCRDIVWQKACGPISPIRTRANRNIPNLQRHEPRMSTTQKKNSRVKFSTTRCEIAASPITPGIHQTLCLLSISLAIAHHRFRLHFSPLFILGAMQNIRKEPSCLTCHLLSSSTKHPQASIDIPQTR